MGWSDWVPAGTGDLRVRYRVQPTGNKNETQLVKEVNQHSRDAIMADTAKLRDDAESHQGKPRDMSFGRFVGRIPMVDFLRLQKSHPDLFSPDAEIARKATIKFMNSAEGRQYRVQKA